MKEDKDEHSLFSFRSSTPVFFLIKHLQRKMELHPLIQPHHPKHASLYLSLHLSLWRFFLNESMNTSIQKCRSLFILSLPGVALTLSCLVFRQWTRGPIHLNCIEETNLFLPSTSLPSLTSLVLRSLLFSLLAQLIFSEWTRAYSKICHRHIRHFYLLTISVYIPLQCVYTK